ncbi:MAG: CPBP family intramembrane glutamic endopeptidase, partial [Candidatus Eisenbacteria bacterium]
MTTEDGSPPPGRADGKNIPAGARLEAGRASSRVWKNRHGLLRVPWRILLFLLLWIAVSIAGSLLIVPLFGLHLDTAGPLGPRGLPLRTLLSGYGLGIAGVFLPGALLVRRFDRRPVAGLGLGLHPRWFRELALGLLLGALLIAAIAGAIAAAGGLSLTRSELPPSSVFRFALLYFLLFVEVALFEEILFRGYILQVLAEGIGKVRASVLLSAIFGLVHAFNEGGTAPGALSTGLAGLLLSLAYFRTRSLLLPIGIHTAWNFVLGWVLAAPVSGEVLSNTPFIYESLGPIWLTGGL